MLAAAPLVAAAPGFAASPSRPPRPRRLGKELGRLPRSLPGAHTDAGKVSTSGRDVNSTSSGRKSQMLSGKGQPRARSEAVAAGLTS